MNFATMLLLTATMSTLVLKTGDRIAVAGPMHDENGVVVFRVAGGGLYSIPESEIDLEATRVANASLDRQSQTAPRQLKVSPAERDRLLRQLEENHSGTPAPPPRYDAESLQPPSRQEAAAQSADEWRWRNEARSHEERIRQSRENLGLLLDEIDRLRSEISVLFNLGFRDALGSRTERLEWLRSQVPPAELEVARARRAYDQFRDDARRQGVMPGWLR